MSLSQSARRVGVKIDRDALIYLGQISEIKTLGSYYDDPQFSKKIPPAGCTSNSVECAGDNIYRATSDDYGNLSAYEQMSFLHHGCDLKNNDLSGKNALIFGEFFLGRAGIILPPNLNISRPKGPSQFGYKTKNSKEIEKLINWIRREYPNGGQIGLPCLFEDDFSCGGCS